jgi:hypothetical protein
MCMKIFMLMGRRLIHQCSLANRFAAMRVESNLARGPFQQLRLAIQRGLTCRLSVLYYRIEGMKSKLEVFKSLFLSVTQYKTRLSWQLTNNGFASQRVPLEQQCLSLQPVSIRPLYFIDDR